MTFRTLKLTLFLLTISMTCCYSQTIQGTTNSASGDTWYVLLAKIVAIPAFLISLWNLLSPYFLKLKLHTVPEAQIQLMEAAQQNTKLTGFNILFTTFSKG